MIVPFHYEALKDFQACNGKCGESSRLYFIIRISDLLNIGEVPRTESRGEHPNSLSRMHTTAIIPRPILSFSTEQKKEVIKLEQVKMQPARSITVPRKPYPASPIPDAFTSFSTHMSDFRLRTQVPRPRPHIRPQRSIHPQPQRTHHFLSPVPLPHNLHQSPPQPSPPQSEHASLPIY
jgi:hypothetical protein